MSPGAFRQRWRQPRLATKLAVLIVGVSLLGVTVSFLLGTSVHRDQLIDATRRSADRLSRTVLAALEDGMLRHDRSMMATIMGAMGEYDVVAGAWVLNDEGRLYVGTRPETVAARSPAFPASLQAVLADADPSSGPTVLITDRDTLLSVQPLENTARCQMCHETDQAVLGHLVIELPLNDLQGQLAAALQPMAIATATALILLVALLVAGVHQLVVRPVEELAKASRFLAQGDLNREISLTSSAEFCRLAEALDRMRISLKTALAEKDRRNEELHKLHRFAIAGAEASTAQEIAQLGLDVLEGCLGVDAAAVYLAQGEERITLAATIGLTPDEQTWLQRAGQGASALRHALGHGAIICRGGPGGRATGAPGPSEGVRHREPLGWERHPLLEACGQEMAGVYVCVPLVSHGTAVGVLEVAGPDSALDSPERLDVLNLLAHEMGVAIHNLMLLARTRELATWEERDRLAREMHDRLAQSLACLKLQAAVAAEAVRLGRVEDVAESLREIHSMATAAYGETREAIFNLRASTRHAGEHWLTTLRAFAEDCARRYGLDVRVETSGDRRARTPDTETQLLLAVQEAVLNACRHAQARQVVVSVAEGVEALQIRVTDNGTGFDPGSTHPPDGYGLRIMRERVEGVGGRMDLRSEPGRGTEVAFVVPGDAADPAEWNPTPRWVFLGRHRPSALDSPGSSWVDGPGRGERDGLD